MLDEALHGLCTPRLRLSAYILVQELAGLSPDDARNYIDALVASPGITASLADISVGPAALNPSLQVEVYELVQDQRHLEAIALLREGTDWEIARITRVVDMLEMRELELEGIPAPRRQQATEKASR